MTDRLPASCSKGPRALPGRVRPGGEADSLRPVPSVVVLDYGSGNLRSAERALVRAGADVEVTADRHRARTAGGLMVPGVGAFAACMRGLTGVGGGDIIRGRLAEGRPVLGVCVGMQVLFERGEEHGVRADGLGVLPGTVRRLRAPVLPHMGWNEVDPALGSALFDGIPPATRFYFVHSYAAMTCDGLVSTSNHGERFVAAVERGPLAATQFHPEKSSAAGARLLANWVGALEPVR
ncbi:MAG: imidazole glycerol phosphate synthase subunit HisH [Pseudonocardiales bacterium]|nr:MAG: imidazole glycerol phosphate synthase subunit HisH [Pseudonocardiales bacterium]